MNIQLENKITRRDFLKISIQIGLPSILLCSCKPVLLPTSTMTPFPTITTTPSPTKTTSPVETPDQMDLGFEPGYLKLHKTGELKNRAEKLWTIMERCQQFPEVRGRKG